MQKIRAVAILVAVPPKPTKDRLGSPPGPMEGREVETSADSSVESVEKSPAPEARDHDRKKQLGTIFIHQQENVAPGLKSNRRITGLPVCYAQLSAQ